MSLLQLCSGIDANAIGGCAQLVFAPIDESFDDDAPLLPSGFRVIPLDPKQSVGCGTCTLDLASTLEVGHGGARSAADASYNLRLHIERDPFPADSQSGGDSLLKQLWQHSDAILCCSLKNTASPFFTFANQAGLDMLETTFVTLEDIMLDKILDEAGMKKLCSQFSTIMQHGVAYLPAGICMSSMNRPVSYKQVVAWRVLNDEDTNHCLAFMFYNWSFV